MVGENAATANSFLFLVSVGLSQSGLLSPIPIKGRHLVEEELTNGDVETGSDGSCKPPSPSERLR